MNLPQQHYRETFERLRAGLPGASAPWLAHLRDRAISAFGQQWFPDTRVEDWKYTDLRSLGRHRFTPATATAGVVDPGPWLFDGTPMHRLVFVDGRLAEDRQAPLPDGVALSGLAALLNTCPERLEPLLGQTLVPERPGLDELNSAFLQDGACLRLERGTVLTQPLHLLFISTGQADTMQTVRNVIEAGPGSKACVIESWVTLGEGSTLTNTVTEIILHEASTLEYCKLVEEAAATTHIGATCVRQHRDSRLDSHSITLGGRLVRNTLQVELEGAGAGCRLNGLTLTRGRQHVDNHTRIEHLHPHTGSSEHYRGILAGRSRTVFSGRIVVHPGAQQTSAQQDHHSLLLSADAEADARPQFEIRADDVQCRHGCTVGELDADALFYLRARGLGEAAARKLLIRAFAAEVLERVPLEPLRRRLERELAGFPDGDERQATEALLQ